MARKVFYSFHYKPDNWRVSQVKNIGTVEGSPLLSSNTWEDVKKGGDQAIRNYIDGELKGRSCTVVLIGAQTAGRRWVKYEIEKSWNDGKGLLGVYVHNLKDSTGNQSTKGKNPFDNFNLKDGTSLSTIVKTYDPPYLSSTNVYDYIKNNLSSWVEEAITIRAKY